MKELRVSLEIGGAQVRVGTITGRDEYDAAFSYADSYLASPAAVPVSVGLPLSEKSFSAARTRAFFEGLLPEGFMRKTVAVNHRTDSGAYLAILELLGMECLGAVRIDTADTAAATKPGYRLLSEQELRALAAEGASRSAALVTAARLSLTGASGKAGVYLDQEGNWYLPEGTAPSTHIVKQSHIRYDHIVQNELLAMRTAKNLGIEVPESNIIRAEEGEADSAVLFATRRYDRRFAGSERMISDLPAPLRLHQEDFAQAMGIAAAEKYEADGGTYLNRMFETVAMFSAKPMEDQMKLFDMVVFHWLIGNTDGHVKNFSLLYDTALKSIRLAPAYDIVSTVVYDAHDRRMAFAIGSEYEWTHISRTAFEKAVRAAGLSTEIYMRRFDRLLECFPSALREAVETLEAEGFYTTRGIAERIVNAHPGGSMG